MVGDQTGWSVSTAGDGDDRLQGQDGRDLLDGGAVRDRLHGGDGDDVLRGRAGDDRLKGGAGADDLRGGTGADVLRGGTGRDMWSGGTGTDRFVFDSAADSRFGAGDVIGDCESRDLIDLIAVDAVVANGGANEAFTWIGEAGFTGVAGELRTKHLGAKIAVRGGTDGDRVADFEITVIGGTGLVAGKFLL